MKQRSREPDLWLFINAMAEIRYCSRPLLRLVGRDAAEIRGMTVTSILPGLPLVHGAASRNVAAMNSCLGGGHPLELTLGDGRHLAVEASVSPDELGGSRAFIVVLNLEPRRPASPLPELLTHHASAWWA